MADGRSLAHGTLAVRAAISVWIAASALTLAACAAPEARETPRAEQADPYGVVRARRTEMAQAFAAQAAYCASRRDTDHYAFHGCIDWHSAAHAAWALAAYENWTSDNRYRAQIDADLTAENIILETRYLAERPDFETPYGRAWFLRLAVERMRMGDHRLDAMARDVANSLRDHYRASPPNPRADRYRNPSWALVNLLLYARQVNDTSLIDFVHAQVRIHFTDARCDLALERQGFIAICTTWAWLVEQTIPAPNFRAWYREWNPGLETLTPVTAYPSAHDYGRNFSRAWGLYHLAEALDDDRLRTSFAAHVLAGFEPDSRWKGDYLANGHWVAQFGMLAIAPMFENGDPSNNPG